MKATETRGAYVISVPFRVKGKNMTDDELIDIVCDRAWNAWLSENRDGAFEDVLLKDIFRAGWKASNSELLEARCELLKACKLLFTVSLPADISGNRMVQEARDIVNKWDRHGL